MRRLICLLFLVTTLLSCRHIGSDTIQYSKEFEEEPLLYQEFDFEDNGKSNSWHKDWQRRNHVPATYPHPKTGEIIEKSQNYTRMLGDRASLENGFLHIRTSDYKKEDNTYTGSLTGLGGSIETQRYYSYGKWEARLKPSSVSGVVNAFFTKDLGNDLQEIDFEFLPYTFDSEKGTGEIHLVIHASGHRNHYQNDVKVDFNPSADFHVYSIEIYTDKVVWRVDGNFLAEYIYDDVVAIDSKYKVFFNGWSSTHVWVKGPPAETADYYIDWVKFYPLKEQDL